MNAPGAYYHCHVRPPDDDLSALQLTSPDSDMKTSYYWRAQIHLVSAIPVSALSRAYG